MRDDGFWKGVERCSTLAQLIAAIIVIVPVIVALIQQGFGAVLPVWIVMLIAVFATVFGFLLGHRLRTQQAPKIDSGNSGSTNDSLRLTLYSSDVQTTELRGTKDGLEVYLIDLRPGKDSGIQGDAISVDRLRRIVREGDVKVYMDDKTPVLDIGPKKHWLYSKTLFGNSKRLQNEIYALIERTIKFAS